MDKTIKQYLSKIGRKGGKSTSAEKVAASQANGKKGGRPKKKNGVAHEIQKKD